MFWWLKSEYGQQKAQRLDISHDDLIGSQQILPANPHFMHHLPSGKHTKSYWKWHIYSGFTHEKWWFSIVFCMFTRG